MQLSRFTPRTSFASPPRRPSTLHVSFSFMKCSTTPRSTPYPVKVKSSPCTTRRTSSLAL
eukprot:11224572-Alexandrium_andersonii.AAC.1